MNPALWIFLPCVLFFFIFPPQIHGHINILDEGFWLATLQALLEGKALYREIWTPYAPVLPWTLKGVFALVPPTLESVRRCMWALNALGLLAIYGCLLRFVRSRDLRLLFACFLWTIPLTAHAFIPMSARYGAGFLALMAWSWNSGKPKQARFVAFGVGALAVLSYAISQEIGVAALIASGYFYARHPRGRGQVRHFLTGCAVALGVMLIAVAVSSGLANYFRCTVQDASQVVHGNRLGFPTFNSPLWRAVMEGKLPWYLAGQQLGDMVAFYFPPLLYAGVLVAAWMNRGRWKEEAHIAISLAIYGILAAVPAWDRSDRWHMYFALSPALLLTAYLTERIRNHRPKLGQKVLLAALGVGIVLTVPHLWAQTGKHAWLNTHTRMTQIARVGQVRLPFSQANGYEALVEWIQTRVKPGEPILFFPYNGAIYFLADRPNPCSFPTFVPSTPDLQQKAIHELERNPPRWIIWDTDNSGVDDTPIEVYLSALTQYIRTHFRQRETLGPFVFWERKALD